MTTAPGNDFLKYIYWLMKMGVAKMAKAIPGIGYLASVSDWHIYLRTSCRLSKAIRNPKKDSLKDKQPGLGTRLGHPILRIMVPCGGFKGIVYNDDERARGGKKRRKYWNGMLTMLGIADEYFRWSWNRRGLMKSSGVLRFFFGGFRSVCQGIWGGY